MIRVVAAILSICFVAFCGYSTLGKINNVSVDYGKSEVYSQQDMDSAIEVIEKEFSSWKGCELHSITYMGDEICRSNIDYCNQLQKGAGFDECIVFESSFHSPINGGDGWEADEEYTGWSWFLARKDNGAWTLLTWGYS